MDFRLDDEAEMFRQMVRDFTRKELAPGVKERTRIGILPTDIIKKMADLGLMGLNAPAELGGQPASWVITGILAEEMGKIDSFAAHTAGLSIVTCQALEEAEESVRKEWVPRIARGEVLTCLAMTEPEAGSDVAAIKTKAVRQGDHYLLTGEKAPITGGRQAGIAIVDAVTDPSAGPKGITCFLVELGSPGVTRRDMHYMGEAEGLASINFDEVRVPAKHVIGGQGKGLKIVTTELDMTRVWAGIFAVAMADITLEETINYIKERKTFGKPIAKYQAVSFKVAEAVARLESAKLLCYKALWLKDQGLPFVQEVAMAKIVATETAIDAIHSCMLIHGHYGFSSESSIEQRLRDAIGEELASGTNDMMKIVICQHILGRDFLPL